jgi:hypothetical protein
MDTTNYIEISFDAGSTYPIKLWPGELPVIISNNGATVTAKANTAACIMQVTAVAT